MILFGEHSLRNAVREYLLHYHTERNHQGLDNQLIIPLKRPPDTEATVETTERLGGMLRSYDAPPEAAASLIALHCDGAYERRSDSLLRALVKTGLQRPIRARRSTPPRPKIDPRLGAGRWISASQTLG